MLFKDHFQKNLNNKISKCKDCRLLANPGPVLGYGSTSADVMFVSDMPGLVETSTGVPFTGKAKENIVSAIKNIGLKKRDYYLTYLLKHSIVGPAKIVGSNQLILSVEHSHCLTHLLSEIELVNPRIICTMGFFSTKAIMKHYKMDIDPKGLKVMHGNGYIIPALIRWNKIFRPMRYLVPTWNPASSNEVMNMYVKKDVLTIKSIRDYSSILFDKAKISKQMTLDIVDN